MVLAGSFLKMQICISSKCKFIDNWIIELIKELINELVIVAIFGVRVTEMEGRVCATFM